MGGRVEGKVAFITGAARGQGRSHAVRLAQEGADIIAIDICEQIPTVSFVMSNDEDLAETVRMVEALDRRIIATKVDVRDFDALRGAVNQGVAELGRLDIVCANAGVGSEPALSHEMSEADWQTTVDVNLTGVWHTTKAVTPHLISGGRGGSIVLTASVAGMKPYAHISNYVATKHALVGLMKTLAVELAPHMIRVNSIHPTQVNTPMILNEGTLRLFVPDAEHPAMEQFIAASTKMNALAIPWVEPVDVSNALLFLSSDEARYITGVALPVDAGCLLK